MRSPFLSKTLRQGDASHEGSFVRFCNASRLLEFDEETPLLGFLDRRRNLVEHRSSATQARGTISRSPASGTNRL